ncbi:ribonuclease III [Thiotrichales bacterium HSG1]|nr:ribonuclease III [Thiotrichales bacterium HSG1]
MIYSDLYRVLAYHFEDEQLLITALTHRSVGTPNNERLEFLGDALLNCIMAKVLFERFSDAREGELTRLRANLVKRDALVKIAYQLELGKYLLLGSGELKTGGEQRTSILSDSVEAVIGAIYLDSDIQTCQSVVVKLWDKLLRNLPQQMKDPKTRLQEYLQSQQKSLPAYKIFKVKGSPHSQLFEVKCTIPGLKKPTYGNGGTRRSAEQSAAEKALGILNVK